MSAEGAGPLSLPERIALACRILFERGHEHLVFGHVSGRDPRDGRIYVKAAGLGLEEVGAMDVVAVDAPDARLPDELPLHLEIYRARPDVGGIVHTHPAAAVAASLVPGRWAVASQDAIPFSGRIAFYPRAELVASEEAGRRLAAALGEARAVLLRGHGLVTVGGDVEEATVSGVLLERALRTLLAAAALGGPEPLPAAEVAGLDAHFEARRAERVRMLWDYLVRSLRQPL